MKVFCAFVLACLGAALAQQTCEPQSFKALTFDTVNFVPSYSYHNVEDSLTLYENINDETTQLYDFGSGTVYVQIAGQDCYRIQSNDGQLTQQDLPALRQQIVPRFAFTDNEGTTFNGYELQNGAFNFRGVITGSCNTAFLSFVVNGQVRVANFFTNPESLGDADRQATLDAKASFEAANCEVRGLDD